jgi:hypothetical protein
MRFALRSLLAAVGAALLACPAVAQIRINEIRIDETGTDVDEYFELAGPANTPLTGYTYLVIGDATTPSCGAIESVTPLDPYTIQADGFFAACKSATPNLTGYDAVGVTSITFENSDNVTHMLVTGFTGAVGGDIDTDNDGVIDTTPWTSIVYSVGLLEEVGPACGAPQTDDEPVYSTTTAGPDGTFVPGHAFYCSGTWQVGAFSPTGQDDTPGAANGCNTIAPNIENLRYSPCFLTAGQQATVSATVTDPNADITSVRVYYKLEASASFDSLDATLGAMDVYSATLPGQADQAHVQYFMRARDAAGNVVTLGTTPQRSYRVGLQTIPSLQVSNGDSCATSTAFGKAVNVVGVVTHRAYEYSDDFFFIQAGIGPNAGIKVFAPDSAFVPNMGDSVRVSGYIDEFRCQTEVVIFADCGTVLGTNRRVRARTLASVGDINNEQHESMLVTIQGPIDVVTGWEPPMGSNQEFRVRQGSAHGWVGNDTLFPDGIGFSTVPDSGITLDNLTGIVGYRFLSGNDSTQVLRIEPRRDNDVDRDYTDVGDDDDLDVVRAFRLHQNQPNPFNPATTIEFAIPAAASARLEVFDAQGRLVRTLAVREYAGPARDRIVWDGADDHGKVVASGLYYYKLTAGEYRATRKMLLLK